MIDQLPFLMAECPIDPKPPKLLRMLEPVTGHKTLLGLHPQKSTYIRYVHIYILCTYALTKCIVDGVYVYIYIYIHRYTS